MLKNNKQIRRTRGSGDVPEREMKNNKGKIEAVKERQQTILSRLTCPWFCQDESQDSSHSLGGKNQGKSK